MKKTIILSTICIVASLSLTTNANNWGRYFFVPDKTTVKMFTKECTGKPSNQCFKVIKRTFPPQDGKLSAWFTTVYTQHMTAKLYPEELKKLYSNYPVNFQKSCAERENTTKLVCQTIGLVGLPTN
ncbi:hypothetical protein [Ferrimonas sp. YFM]|uniref:hypothetical protein n=1 Tax=Ferrimonas sp. YFM TaxID=3028878 RepID=UPI002572E5B1|nr:hypothetical protein [Ferrimonas sp. YFM]